MKKCLFCLFFLAPGLLLNAQDEEEDEYAAKEDPAGFYYGINFGGLLANRHTANFYNGYNGTDAYNVVDLVSNRQVYDQIYNQIQMDFEVGEVPVAMKYQAGLVLGINFGWYTDPDFAFFVNADFARIKLTDVFTLWAVDPNNPSGDPIIYPQVISGEENRMHFDLGIHTEYGEYEQLEGYFELYGTLNSVKPVSNEVLIEGYRYNLLQPPSVYRQNDLGGIGWGFGLGTGVRYRFNDNFSFDLGGNLSFQKINLYIDEKLKLNPVLYLRILKT